MGNGLVSDGAVDKGDEVCLSGPEDWEQWNQCFWKLGDEIRDLIDNNAHVDVDLRPDIASFARSAGGNRALGLDPDNNDPNPSHLPRPIAEADLTLEGRKHYLVECMFVMTRQLLLLNLTQWVIRTVSYELRGQLVSDDSIGQWYARLKQILAGDHRDRRRRRRRRRVRLEGLVKSSKGREMRGTKVKPLDLSRNKPVRRLIFQSTGPSTSKPLTLEPLASSGVCKTKSNSKAIPLFLTSRKRDRKEAGLSGPANVGTAQSKGNEISDERTPQWLGTVKKSGSKDKTYGDICLWPRR
jgi:hypothetical protein